MTRECVQLPVDARFGELQGHMSKARHSDEAEMEQPGQNTIEHGMAVGVAG